MAERLYQLGFNDKGWIVVSQDVTPAQFAGLRFPRTETVAKNKPEFQITSTGQLGRFVREIKDRVQIGSPTDAARYLMEHIYTPFEQFDQEEMWTLLLDAKNRVTHEVMVYRGTVNASIVRVGEIFKEAVRVNATGLILSHCHPSGIPDPSPEDVMVTVQAAEAATLLAIDLLDHIIMGKDTWVSLKERGLGFDRVGQRG